MKLQDDFKAFVDGEVGAGLALRIQTHLAETPEDQKVVDELQLLSKSIREYVTQPEPVGLEATLSALVAAKPAARKRMLFRHQMAWVGGAMACMLLIGLVGRGLSGLSMSSADSAFVVNHAVQTPATTTGSATAPAIPMDEAGVSGKKEEVESKVASPMPSASGAGGFGGGSGRRSTNGIPNVIGGANLPRSAPSTDTLDGEKMSAPPLAPQVGRVLRQPMIQRDASLSLNVAKVADAQHTVEQITAGLGGYVSASNRAEAKGEDSTATMTLRIPGPQFEVALKSIHTLGEVTSESASGLDVTSQVVDMDARVKVLKAEENDYVILLGRARSTGQIIEIKDKLTEIREEIESIGSQEATLKDQVQYSTINLTLSQAKKKTPGEDVKPGEPKPDKWLSDTWTSAIDGLGTVAKAVAQLLIFTLVWLPIWLPLSLLGAWAYRKMKW